ncbi:MAG: 2-C-methyl-D-erythritol 2,4-cyclodiphosphate synthase [Clostridiales bacterium]|nr:2-C-methyl-D-erythritol 2,4-cyclodiphosphate synthase [Clostridiales bacterium]
MRLKAEKTEKSRHEFDGLDIAAIVVCAGKGERTGLAYNKILYHLGVKTVIETTLDGFIGSAVNRFVLVVAPCDVDAVKELVKPYDSVTLCTGGATRTESVRNGLMAAAGCDIAVIHDGARPFITPDIIDASIRSAIEYGSGIAAVPAVDTIKEVNDGVVVRSLPRASLYNMQTPQTFRYGEIKAAYDKAEGTFTDDAEVYERAGYTPHTVLGSYDNIKITNEKDLLAVAPRGTKIGIGFDVHRLVGRRPLILGGVQIPFDKGLDGHSDADVLTHAIMDAMLSAAGLPDIGVLFPDNSDEFLNISSFVLLDRVAEQIKNRRLAVGNISAVIIAQKPKLAGHIDSIRRSLAARLEIAVERVNVSATTTETLGIIGSGDAIAASASCLLTEIYD